MAGIRDLPIEKRLEAIEVYLVFLKNRTHHQNDLTPIDQNELELLEAWLSLLNLELDEK